MYYFGSAKLKDLCQSTRIYKYTSTHVYTLSPSIDTIFSSGRIEQLYAKRKTGIYIFMKNLKPIYHGTVHALYITTLLRFQIRMLKVRVRCTKRTSNTFALKSRFCEMARKIATFKRKTLS